MANTRTTSSSRRLRWAVPAVAALAVGSAVAVPTLASAGPTDLPPRTAAQLLADLAQAEPVPLSGTVVQTSRLGLPELPTGSTGTGPLAMLTGSHTLKVWYDGPERARLALLGQLAEYDAVRSGRDAWTYSSEQDEAAHYTLPAGSPRDAAPGTPPTPQSAADTVLAALDPTTEVRVEQDARVAGRDAYVLVLEPRDEKSLVGSVRLTVDAGTSVPLRVQVWSSRDTATPALEVGFTDVSFARPDASVFAFSPPAGTEVREVQVPAHDSGADRDKRVVPGAGGPQVTGEGWTAVVEVPTGGSDAAPGEASGVLDSLTTRVPEGRLLTTSLLTALLTDDGRVLVGAVPADALRDAARR